MENDLYYGRGIAAGMTEDQIRFLAYFVTGRSSSSKSRRFAGTNQLLSTEPLDQKVLETGNPDLLLYNAVVSVDGQTYAVSNGKQTGDVLIARMLGQGMESAHRKWNYEPDEPNFTPRVSASLDDSSRSLEMGIIRKGENGAERPVYQIQLDPGEFYMITTYEGTNVNPLPSFTGEPFKHNIGKFEGIENLADVVEQHMGNPDYRVALTVQTIGQHKDFLIRNYQE